MKNNWLHLALVLGIALGFASCEWFVEDLPKQSDELAVENDRVYGAPSRPVLVQLLNNDKVGASSLMEITLLPSKGQISMMSNGMAVYKPNKNFTQGSDIFKYAVTCNSEKDSGTVEIIITSDTTQIPCNQYLLSDYVRIELPEDMGKDISIDVLSNDKFCDGRPDPSTLALAVPPSLGAAAVKNGVMVYRAGDFKGKTDDTFLYRVVSAQNPNTWGYGLVVVTQEYEENDSTGPCPTMLPYAEYDFVEVGDESRYSIDVLANDKFCPELLDRNSLSISRHPDHGKAVAENGLIWFYPQAGFEGEEVIVYKFCETSGACAEGKVVVRTKNDDVCNTALPRTEDDIFHAEMDSGTQTVFNIDVLANDHFCKDRFTPNSLGVTNQPSHGKAWVENGAVLYLPETDFEGTDSFAYRFCEGNTCVEGKVTVFVKQGGSPPPCQVGAKDDEIKYSLTQSKNVIESIDKANLDSLGVSDKVFYLEILGNDVICDNQYALYLKEQPSKGKAFVYEGMPMYAPDPDFVGELQFFYEITSANGQAARASVKIHILK